MANISGVFTAIATPFDADGHLALGLLPGLLHYQSAAGIDGVVIAGTNGEGTSLSVAERHGLLEVAMAHRGRLGVIAATGAAGITDAVDLTDHACDLGASAVLVLPPFFFKNPPVDGLLAYFRRILEVSTVPVLLYSIPQFSAVPVTHGILDALAGHPRLLGLKDSSGDWPGTEAFIKRGDVSVFAGSDDLLARALRAGAPGVISGTANAVPELVAGVYRAHRDGGDVDAAQARLDAARTVLCKYPLLAANKAVINHRGLGPVHVRPPLADLAASQVAELIAELCAIGALDR